MTEPEAGPAPEVVAIRDQLSQVNPGSAAHRTLGERLESFYRARYGEPALAPPPADSPSSEDIAAKLAGIGDHPPSPEAAAKSAFPNFEPPPGQTLDVDAVAALRSMELSHDVPVSELTAITSEYRAAWERRGQDADARRDARDARLAEVFGDDAELWLTRAEAVMRTLDPRLRHHLVESTMLLDAAPWERLVERWKKQHAR